MSDKLHLISPTITIGNKSACGAGSKKKVQITDDPELATCEICKSWYERNRQIYDKWLRRRRDGVCQNCGNDIKMAIFRGGPYCCENCRKALVAAGVIDDD